MEGFDDEDQWGSHSDVRSSARRVAYALPEGMGMVFSTIGPDQRLILDQWLEGSMRKNELGSDGHAAEDANRHDHAVRENHEHYTR